MGYRTKRPLGRLGVVLSKSSGDCRVHVYNAQALMKQAFMKGEEQVKCVAIAGCSVDHNSMFPHNWRLFALELGIWQLDRVDEGDSHVDDDLRIESIVLNIEYFRQG